MVLLFVYLFVVSRIQSVLVIEHEGTGQFEGLLSRHDEIHTESLPVSQSKNAFSSAIKLQDKLDQVHLSTGHPFQGE